MTSCILHRLQASELGVLTRDQSFDAKAETLHTRCLLLLTASFERSPQFENKANYDMILCVRIAVWPLNGSSILSMPLGFTRNIVEEKPLRS